MKNYIISICLFLICGYSNATDNTVVFNGVSNFANAPFVIKSYSVTNGGTITANDLSLDVTGNSMSPTFVANRKGSSDPMKFLFKERYIPHTYVSMKNDPNVRKENRTIIDHYNFAMLGDFRFMYHDSHDRYSCDNIIIGQYDDNPTNVTSINSWFLGAENADGIKKMTFNGVYKGTKENNTLIMVCKNLDKNNELTEFSVFPANDVNSFNITLVGPVNPNKTKTFSNYVMQYFNGMTQEQRFAKLDGGYFNKGDFKEIYATGGDVSTQPEDVEGIAGKFDTGTNSELETLGTSTVDNSNSDIPITFNTSEYSHNYTKTTTFTETFTAAVAVAFSWANKITIVAGTDATQTTTITTTLTNSTAWTNTTTDAITYTAPRQTISIPAGCKGSVSSTFYKTSLEGDLSKRIMYPENEKINLNLVKWRDIPSGKLTENNLPYVLSYSDYIKASDLLNNSSFKLNNIFLDDKNRLTIDGKSMMRTEIGTNFKVVTNFVGCKAPTNNGLQSVKSLQATNNEQLKELIINGDSAKPNFDIRLTQLTGKDYWAVTDKTDGHVFLVDSKIYSSCTYTSLNGKSVVSCTPPKDSNNIKVIGKDNILKYFDQSSQIYFEDCDFNSQTTRLFLGSNEFTVMCKNSVRGEYQAIYKDLNSCKNADGKYSIVMSGDNTLSRTMNCSKYNTFVKIKDNLDYATVFLDPNFVYNTLKNNKCNDSTINVRDNGEVVLGYVCDIGQKEPFTYDYPLNKNQGCYGKVENRFNPQVKNNGDSISIGCSNPF